MPKTKKHTPTQQCVQLVEAGHVIGSFTQVFATHWRAVTTAVKRAVRAIESDGR